jgi:hypothetical protein
LFLDWVAGDAVEWSADAGKKTHPGDFSQLILEKASTVDEAIALIRAYNVPAFGYARTVLIDRCGCSALAGFAGGELFAERSDGPVFYYGYGFGSVRDDMAEGPPLDAETMMRLLTRARQPGKYATKYSNIFDLATGEIRINHPGMGDRFIRLGLEEELSKGKHFFHIPRIETESAEKAYGVLPALKIECFIDGKDQILLRDGRLWYAHEEHELPGKWNGNDLPTYVNSKAWRPRWLFSQSSRYRLPPAERFEATTGNIDARSLTPRGDVSVTEYPTKGNGMTLVISIDDRAPGAAWYEIGVFTDR